LSYSLSSHHFSSYIIFIIPLEWTFPVSYPFNPRSPHNSLTTGLWVPCPRFWRFLYDLCLGRPFKTITALEPFSSPSSSALLLFALKEASENSTPHTITVSLCIPFGKRSQAIRSNEDLILRRYPSIQSDFPFSSLSSSFSFFAVQVDFLIRLLLNLNLLLICHWPDPDRLISCLLFSCDTNGEVSMGLPNGFASLSC